VTLTSAWSITASVKPPRSAFVDFPLGRTAGKPDDPSGQMEIMVRALELLASASNPGDIVDLGLIWGDGSWKDRLDDPAKPKSDDTKPDKRKEDAQATTKDDRVSRHSVPQYQNEPDELAADPHCPSCIFLEDSA